MGQQSKQESKEEQQAGEFGSIENEIRFPLRVKQKQKQQQLEFACNKTTKTTLNHAPLACNNNNNNNTDQFFSTL